jgi:hypothetical protein
MQHTPEPLQITVTWEDNDKNVVWKVSDTDIRIWKTDHWYHLIEGACFNGYGHPKPPSAPATN